MNKNDMNELKKALKNELIRHSSSWIITVVGLVIAYWSQYAVIKEIEVVEIQRIFLVVVGAILVLLGMILRDSRNIDEMRERLDRLEGADDESDAADDH